jgi:hypothetical protein
MSVASQAGRPQAEAKFSIPQPGGSPQQKSTMKNLILVAIASLSLGMGVANAQSLSHSAAATQHSQQYDPNTNYVFGGDGA